MMRGKNKKLENLNERRPSASNNLVKTPSLIEQTAKIVTIFLCRNKS